MSYIEIRIKDIKVKLDGAKHTPTTQILGIISVDVKKQLEFSFNDNNILSILPLKDRTLVPEITKEVKDNIGNTLKAYLAGYNRLMDIQLTVENECNCPVGCELEDD